MTTRLLLVHEPSSILATPSQHQIIKGGAERYVDFLATSLQKKFQVERLDVTAQSTQSPTALKGSLQKFNPHIIFLNKSNSLALLCAIEELKIPTLRMHHDHEVYCLRKYKYFPWNRTICTKRAGTCCLVPCLAFIQRDRSSKLGFQLASFAKKMRLIQKDKQLPLHLVGSDFMRRELLQQGYEAQKIHKVPIVPPTTYSKPDFSQKDPQTLLFVGQLVRGKGLDILLQALRLIKAPFHLHVIGDGPQRMEFQRESLQNNVAAKVTFHGWKEEAEIARYRQKASIGIVPSTWPEPFGAVGIEFMRQGLPVIGFDSGGISEWLVHNKTGFLVPWMNKEQLAKGIEKLLLDIPLAFSLGANAYEYAKRFEAERGLVELEERLDLFMASFCETIKSNVQG